MKTKQRLLKKTLKNKEIERGSIEPYRKILRLIKMKHTFTL